MRRIDGRAAHNSEVVNGMSQGKSWERAEADTADETLRQRQQAADAWRKGPKSQGVVYGALNSVPEAKEAQPQPRPEDHIREALGAPSAHPEAAGP